MPDVLHHAPGSITFQGMTWLLSPVPGRSLRYSVKEEEMHKTYRSPQEDALAGSIAQTRQRSNGL